MSHDAPTISVVIPTRDRAHSLAVCLAALEAQAAPSYEIVVVDDASHDARSVATTVDRCAHARLVTGEGRGPAAARNLGARAARASIVCFTDDDCRPGPGWISAMAREVAAGAQAVAGPTVVAGKSECAVASQTITNHLTDWSRSADGRVVGFAPTSNLACTREVHATIPFDETYPLAAGEDRDWCRRAGAAGITISFAPDATVEHSPDATLAGFWRQQVRYGHGAYRFHRSAPLGERAQSVDFYIALARAAFAQGVVIGCLVALAQVATTFGYAQAAFADR